MLWVVINLLKVIILNELLHLGDDVSLADHILAILLLIAALIARHLDHLLGVVIPRLTCLAFVVDVDAAIFKRDGKLLSARRIPY